MTELIGEEIYDEFDPHHQGAQLSSFIPPDAGSGATVAALNFSDVGGKNQDSPLPTAGHDTHTSIGSGPTIIKPIALKAKEGFDALINRSKSAPPTPMEQVGKRPPSKSSIPPKTEDYNNESSLLPINIIDENISAPHPANLTTISGADPQLPRSQPQTPKVESTIPQASHLTPVEPPRIASPNSLEAYFLERKRRGISGSTVSPRVVTPTPGVKGKWFKSTPLNPAERDAADGVKNKGASDMTRDGDGSALASETVMDGNKSNSPS